MNTKKAFSYLIAWYLASVGLLFFAALLADYTNGFSMLALLVVEAITLLLLSTRDNFLTNMFGKLETFLALVVLSWAGFASFVYLGLFIYGA
jgi:hypothetical protein